jgi:lipid-binding SYLF domain-containing protein
MRTRSAKTMRVGLTAVLAFAAVGVGRMGAAWSADDNAQLVQDANQTIAQFRKADPSIERFFQNSAGYVVFPGIGKGGLGIGGAHGNGVLFEKGQVVGKVTMNQVTVGAQAGGQEFAEIIFLETPSNVTDLKFGKTKFSAELSAVALSAGAAAKAKFIDGVAVFTATKGGLMLEASVGGQKFKYTPIAPR